MEKGFGYVYDELREQKNVFLFKASLFRRITSVWKDPRLELCWNEVPKIYLTYSNGY